MDALECTTLCGNDTQVSDQRVLLVLFEFIGMLGVESNISELAMDDWSSVKATGVSFDLLIGIVGNCNFPQSKWFRHKYAIAKNITSVIVDIVPHDTNLLILVTLCSLWRLNFALMSVTFIPSEFLFAMDSKNAPNSSSWVSDIHFHVIPFMGESTRIDFVSY